MAMVAWVGCMGEMGCWPEVGRDMDEKGIAEMDADEKRMGEMGVKDLDDGHHRISGEMGKAGLNRWPQLQLRTSDRS